MCDNPIAEMDVGQTTKTYYDKAVERIRKAVAPGTTGLDFLATTEPVIAWIEDQGSNNSRKTYYSVVKSVLTARKVATDEEAIQAYGKRFTAYFKRVKEAGAKQEPMEKEVADGQDPLTWDEAIKAREQLVKDEDWQNACLLGCYTYLPPRRCDYAGMKVVKAMTQTKDTNWNFCVLRKVKPVFIFNKYKTDKTYGQQVIDISAPHADLIRKWRETNTTDWLFIKGNGDPMDSHRLSQHLIDLLERTTGKKAGASLLRHAFLTDLLKDEKPIADKKPIADMMAHSTATQELYARK
jgi:hypothetical protein